MGSKVKSAGTKVLKKFKGDLKFGNPTKIKSQMKKRGWDEDKIREALATDGIPTKGKKGAATRYEHPKTKASVTIDNDSGEIFHVGKPGYKYDDYDK